MTQNVIEEAKNENVAPEGYPERISTMNPGNTKKWSATLINVRIRMSTPILPPDNSDNNGKPAHVHSFTWQTITAPTKEADGLEGEMCSCGAVKNTQPLSAYGYALNEYAPPMINAAKSGRTILNLIVRIRTGRRLLLPHRLLIISSLCI